MHEISLKPEVLFHLWNIQITNTLFTSIIVIVLLLTLFLALASKFSAFKPSKVQIAFEMLYDGLGNIFKDITGDDYAFNWIFSLVFCLFIYILISNWVGLIPFVGTIGFNTMHGGEHRFLALFRAPTSDLSVTLGFALLSVILANVLGFKNLGIRFMKRYFDLSNPINFIVGLLELISEFGKIISFSFRLFGNVFAGEVLLAVITYISWGVATLPFFGLEFFVGFIQAFVFFMLTTVFIKLATSSH